MILRIYVEKYAKIGRKSWSWREYDEEDEAISLAIVPIELSLGDLYSKVMFEPAEIEDESTDSATFNEVSAPDS